MDSLVCVKDFQIQFSKQLGRNAREYFNSGSEEEITTQDNRNAYLRWLIKPRVLVDVSSRDLSTMVLGKPISFPLGVSPMAFQKVAHADGEIAIVKAAEKMGIIYTLSTFATSSIEEIAEAAPNCRKWFQLFVWKNKEEVKSLISRAEASGFEAIVLTADAQKVGKRRANARNPFNLPSHLRIANFVSGKGNNNSTITTSMAEYVQSNLEQGLTWDIIKFTKSLTKLPVILKGILTLEDAILGVHYGVNAIYISNHGGRQVDTFPTTLDVLPEIAKVIGRHCEIYIDGGVMRGADIFKARALGATMVFAGRPLIWGVGVNGEVGAQTVLSILKDELDLTMALAGVPKFDCIRRDNVVKAIKSVL